MIGESGSAQCCLPEEEDGEPYFVILEQLPSGMWVGARPGPFLRSHLPKGAHWDCYGDDRRYKCFVEWPNEKLGMTAEEYRSAFAIDEPHCSRGYPLLHNLEVRVEAYPRLIVSSSTDKPVDIAS